MRGELAQVVLFMVLILCIFSGAMLIIHYGHVEKIEYIKHGYSQIYQGGNLVWVPGSNAIDGELGAAR